MSNYTITMDYYIIKNFPINNITVKFKAVSSSNCLHDQCSICEGTGRRKDGIGGMCVHMISCPCEKCSFR